VSGYGLGRELRDTYGPDLPIIFVSGSRVDAIDRTAMEALAAGRRGER